MICTGLAVVAAAAVAAKYHTKMQFLSLASIIFATAAAAAAAARIKHKENTYRLVKPINGVFHSYQLDLILIFQAYY
jgi:hypothetical protein